MRAFGMFGGKKAGCRNEGASLCLPGGLLAERPPEPTAVTAYICSGWKCQPPVTALEVLENGLAETEATE